MTDASQQPDLMAQADTTTMTDVLKRELKGADRLVIETRNALGEMDAYYLHAPTVLESLERLVSLDGPEVRALVEALRFIDEKVSWEIAPNNYDHQDVCDLNSDWIEVGNAAEAAIRARH